MPKSRMELIDRDEYALKRVKHPDDIFSLLICLPQLLEVRREALGGAVPIVSSVKKA